MLELKEGILIKGMTCQSCEKIIRKQAFLVDGLKDFKIDYTTGKGYAIYDPSKTDIDAILDKIEEKGYTGYILKACPDIKDEKTKQSRANEINNDWISYAFIIAGVLIAGYFILQVVDRLPLPQLGSNISYGLLFVVGLLTGFHCVAMCGGFVVSYTTRGAKSGAKPHELHFMYAVGKLTSYTLIGAAFGFLGSIIAFTPFIRGMAGIIAGAFLVIFGLNMLDISPALKKFRITTPEFITKWVGIKSGKHDSPLIIGLLNGLMIACGPLQALYIMAAGTGSAIEGAKLLFIFGLGTLPVMLGFGYLTTYISSKMAGKILRMSGVVVVILGLIMINRGLSLTGTGYDLSSFLPSLPARNINAESGISGVINNGYQEIRMDVLASGWSPNKFVLKKGMPVKWIINGKQITGCNNAIQASKLGLNFNIKKGEQIIEFTPNEEGTIPFSCWMGMIRGTFIVKDNIDLTDKGSIQKELDAVQVPKGGGCGGGGCGCGGR